QVEVISPEGVCNDQDHPLRGIARSQLDRGPRALGSDRCWDQITDGGATPESKRSGRVCRQRERKPDPLSCVTRKVGRKRLPPVGRGYRVLCEDLFFARTRSGRKRESELDWPVLDCPDMEIKHRFVGQL